MAPPLYRHQLRDLVSGRGEFRRLRGRASPHASGTWSGSRERAARQEALSRKGAKRARRISFAGRVRALFEGIDLLVVPAQAFASPTTQRMVTLGEDPALIAALLRFTCPFDMTGSPTITLPCGFTDRGTPIAFQFVTRHLEEELLVRAGHAFQTVTDWHRRHPAL